MLLLRFICLCSLVILSNLNVSAEDAAGRSHLSVIKCKLAGDWLLVEGAGSATTGNKTLWTVSENGKIKDSTSLENDIKYMLVETEDGQVWMMILPDGPGRSGPMVMRVRIDGSTLNLDYVDIGPDGVYGPLPSGGLTFRKKDEGGVDLPAAAPVSGSKDEAKPEHEPEHLPK